MGFFDLDSFFGRIRDIKENVSKRTSSEQILEIARMQYDKDRDEAYDRYYKETLSDVNEISIINACSVFLVIILQLVYCKIINLGYIPRKFLYVDLVLAILGIAIIIYKVVKLHRSLDEFRYTNIYSNYIITDDWYLAIEECDVTIQGENIDIKGIYILGINGDEDKEFKITREQYEKLDVLDDDEVIVIDMLKIQHIG